MKSVADSVDTTNIKTSIETDLKSDVEFKKSVKGEKGEDGKSIKSLAKDENNNIIVTFSDNTTQNIGQLNIDVSADFLTSTGFGNIRCINSKFQYYNGSDWIDITLNDSNKFIVNLIPKNMKIFNLTLDKSSKSIKLNWTEPSDTIVDGELLCFVEGVKIVRKLGGIPESETDGDLILDIKKKDFGKYKSNYYIDSNINFTIGNKYYYKFFPYANTGMVNNSDINCTFIEIKEHSLFGFKIDQTESDPDSMITYIEDNENYTPVKMDYETNLFNYGDWTKDNAWFMNIRPCMLNYNGTVDYYLDPNDYTKKEDGTDSDINNINYKGNAMIQFPKIYYKIVPSSDGNSANVYISDIKIDDNYHCWSHIDANGNEIDYCYMPIYEGSLDSSNTLRSMSNQSISINTTGTQEFKYANNNNILGFLQNCWFIETYSDTLLIKILVLLISKSTDSQRIFGNGNCGNTNVLQTGTMNDKGLFWGSNQNTFGIKIFGMENYWGNRFRRIAGWFSKQGIQKVKLTYGKTDGSNIEGYQNNSENYIEIPNSVYPSGDNMFITKMLFSEYGFFAKEASSGSSSTYYCDATYSSANIVNENTVLIGCDYHDSINGWAGIFFYCGNYTFDRTFTTGLLGASICCKPILKEDN